MASILVAVADRDECELYIFALRFAGHQPFGASDIREVDQLVRNIQPDLVLMDTHLLNTAEQTPGSISTDLLDLDIPVIYLGDQEQRPEILNSIKSQAGEYLYRPISIDQLTNRVNQSLKMAKKR